VEEIKRTVTSKEGRGILSNAQFYIRDRLRKIHQGVA
jgi:hypothetical protein